jgi:protein-S-isoprenylcysteine O-methyltransferase Ste14
MPIEPWNLVFLAGFIAYVAIRGAFKRRTKGNEITLSRMDTLEKMLLALVIPGGLLLPLIYIFTPWLTFADYHLPAVAAWCGTGLMVAALWLFWHSHVDLGLNWSQTLELRKGHEIVKQGVYRLVRHPMYASIWLWCLAQGLLLENWLAGWYAGVAFAIMYFVRTPREERMMCEAFGDEYRDYMRQTGRLFPRMGAGRDQPGGRSEMPRQSKGMGYANVVPGMLAIYILLGNHDHAIF